MDEITPEDLLNIDPSKIGEIRYVQKGI